MDLNSLYSDVSNETINCFLRHRDYYNSTIMCSPFWDNIFCWPPTSLDSLVSIPCSFIFNESLNEYRNTHFTDQISTSVAIRKCAFNGSWEWNAWTNYSQCFDLLQAFEKEFSEDKGSTFASILRYMVLVGSFVSTVALVISIAIFSHFKLLFCARNTIHKNLCVSLLLQSLILMLISSRALLMQNSADYSQSINHMNSDILCKLIKAISIYALMSTVHWMFIEGLSLHTTLYFTPFAKNKHLMKLYYIIGWMIPFVSLAVWIIALEVNDDFESQCWKGYGTSKLIWIITSPMLVALTLNFVFLINIVRLLTSKLREGLEKKKTLKTIKATALLIPLLGMFVLASVVSLFYTRLGLEHLVFCINPRGSSPELESIYIAVNAAIQSLQGIAVSFLYCFTNNEVRTVLQNSWARRRLKRLNYSANSSKTFRDNLLQQNNDPKMKTSNSVFL